jgi:molybdopterin synthase sulfur carrier subunit
VIHGLSRLAFGGWLLKIRVKFFASYREIVGQSDMVLELKEGTTVWALLGLLREKHPKLGSLTDTIIASVNKRYAREDVVLKEGDEVALLPPVSGG